MRSTPHEKRVILAWKKNSQWEDKRTTYSTYTQGRP